MSSLRVQLERDYTLCVPKSGGPGKTKGDYKEESEGAGSRQGVDFEVREAS